jgi:hypothetical protein
MKIYIDYWHVSPLLILEQSFCWEVDYEKHEGLLKPAQKSIYLLQ